MVANATVSLRMLMLRITMKNGWLSNNLFHDGWRDRGGIKGILLRTARNCLRMGSVGSKGRGAITVAIDCRVKLVH